VADSHRRFRKSTGLSQETALLLGLIARLRPKDSLTIRGKRLCRIVRNPVDPSAHSFQPPALPNRTKTEPESRELRLPWTQTDRPACRHSNRIRHTNMLVKTVGDFGGTLPANEG
jgi:hypothetical protein